MKTSNPTWIWYPGDFEVWLGNIFNNRRTERGVIFPPFWKQDSHWPTVAFTKSVDLDEDIELTIYAEGEYSFSVDGKLQAHHQVPKGHHELSIKVWNQATPPAIFVTGGSIVSDATWMVTYEDKIWIDENGVAHGSGIYVPAGCWNFDSPSTPPSQYRLERKEMRPVNEDRISPAGMLYDFGREMLGYLKLNQQKGTLEVFYGESREEALDKEHCETLDVLREGHRTPGSKAFRYIYIEAAADSSYGDVLVDFEYAPFSPQHSGSFRCSDDELNRIWEVSAYTLELTTREFFMDGIKRDRWTWSGDAIQSYLMNYYLHFDTECVKRTIRQLRGKDPVTAHVNTIMDYTFYWFISLRQFLMYTGDLDFIKEMFPRIKSLMDYVESRLNEDGFAEGKSDDWVFVDWTDFPMHKRGVLCFEQLLLLNAYLMLFVLSILIRRNDLASYYASKAKALQKKIPETFWDEERGVFWHSLEDGELNKQITKFPHIMAIVYGLLKDEQKEKVAKNVLLNPDVPPITTPYMRFYELEALCITGHHDYVMKEIKDYWGGMLREGATSFWEKYNPEEHGAEHLAMYGRPYGKSLCHAWGASPLYLLGRYFLGVKPTRTGYTEFEVKPVLGGLEWMEGDVPTPRGLIHVYMDKHQVKVLSSADNGWLCLEDERIAVEAGKELIVELKQKQA